MLRLVVSQYQVEQMMRYGVQEFMDGVTILGYSAATLTTCAFLPQVLQIWRSKSTKDISLPMLLTFILGISLWFVYGVLVNSYPVVVANLITLVLNLWILFFKFRYG